MMMRQRFVGLLVAGVFLVGVSFQTASGNFVKTGDKVKITPPSLGGTYGGGPFTAVRTVPSPGPTFITLCLEKNETFDYNTQYWVTVDTAAKFNGDVTPPIDFADPLDMKTAYLYKTYVSGALDGVFISGNDFSSTDVADLRGVQEAAWSLENETFSPFTLRGQQILAWINGVSSSLLHSASDVRVMNMWTTRNGNGTTIPYTYSGAKQSMMTIIPEPASLLGWIGVASVFTGGFFLRRRRAQ